jgi:transposase
VIHDFNTDGFDLLSPHYTGGRPPVFTLKRCREISLAISRLPTTTCRSRRGAAGRIRGHRGVDDISHEGLRLLLHEEGVSFQRLKTSFGPSRHPLVVLRRQVRAEVVEHV